MQAEPLIHWSEPIAEFIGMIAQFIPLGAVGFRFAAVRNRLGAGDSVYADATQRAAQLGLVAIVVQAVQFAMALPRSAARAHTSAGALLTNDLATGAQAALLVIAIIGFALASGRRHAGWPLALVGVVLAPLTGMVSGKWSRLVNPVHRVAAGLWLGTLFVLVAVGLRIVLDQTRTRERRGEIAAELVNGFSPLALTCGMIVVLSGLTTAWLHLNPLSSLWSTPYGYALIVKLCIVAVVFALGAWNWKRVRPTLGSEDAAHAVRRSSRGELTAATLVLVASAILVSLPSPKPPGAPPPQVPPSSLRPAREGGALGRSGPGPLVSTKLAGRWTGAR
jgi:putative copper export protein